MEGQYKTQIRVGIFLGLGLLAALISILALGGDKSLFRHYTRINASLEQVQGLSRGSVVSLSGMTIGNIESIDFVEGQENLVVTMRIDGRFQPRIPKDSTVEVRTQGALGDKFIYITPGTAKEAVKEGDSLQPLTAQDLIGVLTEKGAAAEKILSVISEAEKLMKAINGDGRSEKMMRNLTEATADFKVVTAEARELIGDLKKENAGSLASSMHRLDSILTKIDKGEGSLGALINDPAIHEQLKALLGGSPRKQYFQNILQNSIEKK